MPTDADDPGPGDAEPVFAPPQRGTEKVSAVPRDNTPPPPPARAVDDAWPHLLELFKSKLPMAKRAFLNMAGGRMEGDRLYIECDNELVKSTLSKNDVVAVFQSVATEYFGKPIAVQVVVGQPQATAAAGPAREPGAKPAAAPARDAADDPLSHLLNQMQKFDNLKID